MEENMLEQLRQKTGYGMNASRLLILLQDRGPTLPASPEDTGNWEDRWFAQEQWFAITNSFSFQIKYSKSFITSLNQEITSFI